MEPFVALIVSPWDIRLPSAKGEMEWFRVDPPVTDPIPMVVEVEVSETINTPEEQLKWEAAAVT